MTKELEQLLSEWDTKEVPAEKPSRPRILVVDDAPSIRRSLSCVLNEYEVGPGQPKLISAAG